MKPRDDEATFESMKRKVSPRAATQANTSKLKRLFKGQIGGRRRK